MAARLTEMSRDEACAHLLRHLGDIGALRGNPLAGSFFAGRTPGSPSVPPTDREALERVRRMVRAAAEALRHNDQGVPTEIHAERQYTILLRCDLGHEPHANVAADLGLSLRHFYRERRNARAWVAAYLVQSQGESTSSPQVRAVFDPHAFKIAHAHRLYNSGAYSMAITLLQNLVEQVDNPARRLETYCLLTTFFIETHQNERAYLTLLAARECYEAIALQVDNVTELRGRLEMATAKYLWAAGQNVAALNANEKALDAFREVRFRPRTDACPLLATALIELAHTHILAGSVERARSAINEARQVLDDVAATPPHVAAQFLNVLGLVQSRSLESMDEAILTFRSALDIATHHGLGREAIFSMSGLSLHMQLHDDIATATAYIRDCLALGESMLTLHGQSLISLRMLELEALSRRPHDATKHAAGIRDQFPFESYHWNEAVLFSAMGSLGAGDFVVAHQMSQLVADVAASKNLLAVYGAAQRVHAAACEGLNQHGLAQAAIRRAIEVLETSGSFYNLLLAYEVSVRITGDRRHARCVHDLRSSAFQRLQLAGPDDLNLLATVALESAPRP